MKFIQFDPDQGTRKVYLLAFEETFYSKWQVSLRLKEHSNKEKESEKMFQFADLDPALIKIKQGICIQTGVDYLGESFYEMNSSQMTTELSVYSEDD